MQRRAFLLQFHLYDLLGVVPGGAGVGHEDGLVETKDRNRDQISDKEEWFDESKSQGSEEDGEKDVEHAFLRVLGADLNHFFAVGNRCLLRAIEFDVGFDELHGAIGTGSYGLRGCASKPIDHRAARNQAQKERRVQERELVHIRGQAIRQRHDDGEDHRRCADHGGSDQHRFCGGLEGVACAVVLFEQVLGAFKIHIDVEVFLDLGSNIRHLLDQRKFIDRLRIVGDRTIGIDRDRHRAHAEEAEGNQAEGKHRCCNHGCRHAQAHLAEEVGDRHQGDHRKTQPIPRKISGDKAGEDSERRATFFCRSHHFVHVAGVYRGEDFDQFRNHRSGQRSAGDDRGQLPPL